MSEQWHWAYIKPANVINPEETWPGFYRIWDDENNTIAHIEVPKDGAYYAMVVEIVDRYNRLKEEEAKCEVDWAKEVADAAPR